MQTLILWTPHPQHSDKCVAAKKTEKPRHHRSRLAPTASPRRRALRFCATPQEPALRHRQGTIPPSAHRGRLEHVHSYPKPLPRGRSPPARRHSALLRRRATPAEHAPRPPRPPTCQQPQWPSQRSSRLRPGDGKGTISSKWIGWGEAREGQERGRRAVPVGWHPQSLARAAPFPHRRGARDRQPCPSPPPAAPDSESRRGSRASIRPGWGVGEVLSETRDSALPTAQDSPQPTSLPHAQFRKSLLSRFSQIAHKVA